MWHVVAFYNFLDLTEREELQTWLKKRGGELNMCGIILLAEEGINGTISGPTREAVEEILSMLPLNDKAEIKWSTASLKPFWKFKVRLKKEIITMRAPEANPHELVGDYVAPEDWNDLLEDDDVIVLDTRNDYEVEMGSFKGAIDPKIEEFTQFKDFVEKLPEDAKDKKVAMFCTGGIRCEKASAYMKAHGYKNVYHLKGGILKYLETVPKESSKWEGSCFVFDKRIAVDHGLEEAVV